MNYKILSTLESGYSIIMSNNRFGIIDKSSNIIQKIEFNKIGNLDEFYNDNFYLTGFKKQFKFILIPFIIDEKIGWFNQNYEVVISPFYEIDTETLIQNLFFTKNYLLFRYKNKEIIIDRFGNNCIENIQNNSYLTSYNIFYFKDVFSNIDFTYRNAFDRYILIECHNEKNMSLSTAFIYDLEKSKPIYFDEYKIYFDSNTNTSIYNCIIVDYIEFEKTHDGIKILTFREYDYILSKNGNVTTKKLSFFESTKRASLIKIGGWLYKNKLID